MRSLEELEQEIKTKGELIKHQKEIITMLIAVLISTSILIGFYSLIN
jgi:hypothetical protein